MLACCEVNWACTSDSGHCPVGLLVRYNELAIFFAISRELSIRLTNFLPLMSLMMEMFVCGRMSMYFRNEMLKDTEHLCADTKCLHGIQSNPRSLKM